MVTDKPFVPTSAAVERAAKNLILHSTGEVIAAPPAAELEGAKVFSVPEPDGYDRPGTTTGYVTETNRVLTHFVGAGPGGNTWLDYGEGPDFTRAPEPFLGPARPPPGDHLTGVIDSVGREAQLPAAEYKEARAWLTASLPTQLHAKNFGMDGGFPTFGPMTFHETNTPNVYTVTCRAVEDDIQGGTSRASVSCIVNLASKTILNLSLSHDHVSF
jgi:hypothetical protein